MASGKMWRTPRLKKSYDVVIIGGGAHGLATAYYLAKMGVKDVAVLEAKFVGYGGSGRNTAILRSNYRTPEGVRFYDESLKLYEDLARELDFNLMFSQQGHFTLGHSTGAMNTLTTRAEVNKAVNVTPTDIHGTTRSRPRDTSSKRWPSTQTSKRQLPS